MKMILRNYTKPVISVLILLTIGVAAQGDQEPTQGGAPWSLFRGNPEQTGVAKSTLPDAPELKWKYQASGGIETTAAIDQGTVFVTSLDGYLSALDLGSGKLLWKFQASDEIKSSPSTHSGMVYFGDEKGMFYAIDGKSGAKKWTFQADAGIVSSANFFQDRMVFGSYDNNVYCLNMQGKLLWKLETAAYVHGTPAILQGTAIVTGCDGILRMIRITDGKQLKTIELGGYVAASPAVNDRQAFIGTFTNKVLGVDLQQAKLAWQFEDKARRFPFYSSAALADGFLYLGGRDRQVHALDAATGKQAWKFNAAAKVDSSPVVVGGRIYIGTTSGRILALDKKSGKELWNFAADSSVVSSPAVAAGRLLISSTKGTVYCFG